MIWQEFQAATPELARLAQEQFQPTGLALLGTIRRDGTPRISPIEPVVVHDHLLLGMLWRSTKALDLLRDPRCILHSAITSLAGTEPEVKLRGQGVEVLDPDQWERHRHAFAERWGARAPERFHIFSLVIEHAAYITYDTDTGEMVVKQWDPQRGLRETRRPYR
jgi:hypothetical protein